jgi:hypothetical protein
MHRIFHLIYIILFSLVLNVYSQEKESFPVFFIDNTKYEFPPVHQGTNLTHTFKVKNMGNKDLIIHKLKPG